MSYTKALLISSYDDISGLSRGLTYDVIAYFDRVFILEGIYKGFPVNPDHTNQYMNDYINRLKTIFSGKISYEVMDGFKQIEKRNRLFEMAKNYNFGLVMDSDEQIVIDPEILDGTLSSLMTSAQRCFPVEMINLGSRMFAPRMFKNMNGLHCKQSTNGQISHGSIYDENDKEIIHDIWSFRGIQKGEYINGIKLTHDKEMRTKQRIIRDCVYQSTVLDR